MTRFHAGLLAGASHPSPDPAPPRFLTQEMYQGLLAQIHAFTTPHGQTEIHLDSSWRSDVRWGRNRITKSGEWRDVTCSIRRFGEQTRGAQVTTNQFDSESLRSMVRRAEQLWRQFDGRGQATESTAPVEHGQYRYTYSDAWTRWHYPTTHTWSDATYAQTQDTRLDIATRLMGGATAAGMLSAGYLRIEARGVVQEHPAGPAGGVLYAPLTLVQCSMTVRDPAGDGSGWAGSSSYDWGRIDADKLAAAALDKCLKSRNPVRIEPGRYTVIMEPQATYDFLAPQHTWVAFRLPPAVTNPVWPTHDPRTPTRTKLGQRIVDERINLTFDPLDPDLGRVPFDEAGYPLQPVRWITKGVLTELSYDSGMSREQMRALRADIDPLGRMALSSFRLDGGDHRPTPLEEMIATTERGLLVTRFADVINIDSTTGLMRGTTRDGLWLIERGTIRSAVKNLIYTDSPFFAFNRVEQLGAAVPIFSPGLPALTPPIKVREFSFVSLGEAV